jgi:uncharacterized protein YfaT (DUF1175 family)
MRAPSKRWMAIASLLVVSIWSLAWSLDRLVLHAGNLEGAPAYAGETAASAKQKAARDAGPASGERASLGNDKWVDAGDGIPDFAELHTFQDQDSFRRWFAAIAEMQFYQLSEAWNPEQRDCASLVRFAVREALRRHDRPWFRKMGPGYESVAPDVAAFDLDHNPLGERIFRTDFGSLRESDLRDGKFSEFADGRALKNFNSVFVSRSRREARPGDLLFFYQPWVQKFPYHVMIFLGMPRIGANGAHDWVVYHTGSSPNDRGTVKKVELSVLDHHPDPRWRPVDSNENFLGFYRLKIVE